MGNHNPFDPMLPFGADKCRCTACGLYFNSSYAFERHRGNQGCLTVEELRRKGWGVVATGHWVPRAVREKPKFHAPSPTTSPA